MANEVAKTNQSVFAALQTATPPTSTDIVPLERTSSSGSFVGFSSQRSKRYDDVRAAIPGIADAAAYLFDPARGYVRLDQLKFSLLDRFQAWVKSDDDYNPESAKLKKPPKEDNNTHKEVIEAVIALYLGEQVIITNVTFRGAQCPVITDAADPATAAASKPSWGETSADHKTSLQVPDPRYRVVTQVTTFMKPGKTGRSYPAAKGTPRPISSGEIMILAKSLPELKAQYERAKKSHDYKVERITKVVKG